MNGTVLVAGDANPDLVLRGDVIPRFGQHEQILESADLLVGGSGSITASGLARLAVPTAMCAVIGDDYYGDFMAASLRERGVDVSSLRVDPGVPTGLSVILAHGADRAILTAPGTIPLLDAASIRSAAADSGATHLHLTSLFLQSRLTDELPELLHELRTSGLTVSLDTNDDPSDRWTSLSALLPAISFLFPNVAELRSIGRALGAAGDAAEVARRIAVLGPTVVVKDGASGAWSVGAEGDVLRAAAPNVEVADTAGAGDSFAAAYLAAMWHGEQDPQERLRWATLAGAFSVQRSGGTAGQPTLEELRAAL